MLDCFAPIVETILFCTRIVVLFDYLNRDVKSLACSFSPEATAEMVDNRSSTDRMWVI
ncbi:hypothetical protein HALLA_05720 [Halostagnicola larsenii XH-48]|uniref:Uncharacterized protein n=1 Tax=Halostagnicola larsenii XH-48 TaxID=797299 RepID=W0JQ33_9EURY|nr:hypothetical protein HALLA_05720 [Halostagnicola larsenii XH-48]